MIFEIFNDNGNTIGYVKGKSRIEVADTILSAFPKVARINISYSLPIYDPRCKKIAENVYVWDYPKP